MKKLNLETTINASPENVWDAIVNDAKYRIWTSAFQEGPEFEGVQDGSHFEGGWNKGDSILFVAVNKDGKKEGMVSEIAESDYPKYISIRHLGYILNGVVDTSSDEIKKWAPSYENYTFERVGDNTTRFILDMDVTDEFYDMFMDLWPKALLKLKELCEGSKAM